MMESGERLASSTPSQPSIRSPAPASASPPSPTTKSAGHLLQLMGDPSFGLSTSFPMLSHPALRLYSTLSGGSHFGGLGTLGMPGALAPLPQLGTFPDWWRVSDVQTHGAAALFPTLLGLPPLFTPPALNQSNTPSKSTQASAKVLNGTSTGNGKVHSASSGASSTSSSPSPAVVSSEPTSKSGLNPQNHSMFPQNHSKPNKNVFKSQRSATKHRTDQVNETASHKPKKKKLCTTVAEVSSNTDSQSGSSSDSSSDTLSSMDSCDLENEIDEDEDRDLSLASGDSDSEKEEKLRREVKSSAHTGQVKSNFVTRTDMSSVDARCVSSCTRLPGQRSSQITPQPPPHTPSVPALFNSSQREELSKHTSVIQTTGLAVNSKPPPLSSRLDRDPDASSKPLCLAVSPKLSCLSSSSKPLSFSSSPNQHSITHSSSPKSCSGTSSPSPLTLKISRRSSPDETSLHSSQLKQEALRLAFSPQLKEHYETNKSLKKRVPSSALSPHSSPKFQSQSSNPLQSKQFLSSTLLQDSTSSNRAIQNTVQDAPLALITKPRSLGSKTPDKPSAAASTTSFNAPINLSAGAKNSALYPTVAAPDQASIQLKSPGSSHRASAGQQSFRGTESDITSSRDSDDDSAEDDEDEAEDEDDRDSGDSLSDSSSNLDSDSDDDDDDDDDDEEEDEDIRDDDVDTDTESQQMRLKVSKGLNLTNPSNGRLSNSDSFNVQNHALPVLRTITGSVSLTNHSTPSSSFSLVTYPGSGKRRRVTDEQALRRPLDFGWQRETHIKNISGRVQGEVAYYAPCGKKLRQYPDVMKYLARNGISEITRDNFSFSAKIRVGDFYEAQEGPEGLQWCLLKEDEVVSRVLAMEGQRGRAKRLQLQHPDDPLHSHHRRRPSNGTEATNAKLMRKLEAQEIARQAAQMKLMRKLEKQALARAAKEAKKKQALLAAEEKRKQKEQLKILKQQEKMRRIEQIRVEKELRAQQILEAKRKKKEEAANAKILEAEKRIKEKELRRQQAIILKHQELERHRLDMERERRRQHIMLMKAVEARRKAEERERLKQEKRDEKRLNKERKLELRRLELEMVKELNKPNEDMCLVDHKALPELSRLPGLLLPSGCLGDCLMVMQFLRCFGKVLRLDTDPPTLNMLQAGLLSLTPSATKLQDLLVSLLSAAVCDPGLPPGQRAKTALGEHISSVDINRENVSEILQIYMAAHCSQTELSPLVESLRTKAFQAHTPSQKASMLAFLVNELACSKSVVAEIDKNIEHMTNLRREKWVIEGSLRKLRSIHTKLTGKLESSVGGEESQNLGTPSAGRKRKKKVGDSDDDDEEDDDSDDQGEEDDEDDDERGKKGRKTETCDEEDDGDQTTSVEELEKQIEKLTKQQLQIRRKLFESSPHLRSMMLGQDRYKRRYWILPQCGGVFVESMESGEGPQGIERERLQNTPKVFVKEEPTEVPFEKPFCAGPQVKQETSPLELQQEKDSINLFLQKPDSFSKLSQLLEVAKMSSTAPQGSFSTVPPNTEPLLPNGLFTNSNQEVNSELIASLSPTYFSNRQQQVHSDQLYRALTERTAHWFSLLPRSPCDDLSLTSTNSSSTPQFCKTKDQSRTTLNGMKHATALFGNVSLKALQMKPEMQMMGLPFSPWQPGTMSPNMTYGCTPTSAAPTSISTEGTGNSFPTPSTVTCKSESPAPSDEKSASASPALEMIKNQDLTSPEPIPQEMVIGWWKVSNSEELSSIVKACHPRGSRERILQKQLQKHMEYLMQVCAKNKDATVIDVSELEQSQVCKETVRSWCVEEHAMDLDIAVLQQVEELARKVTSASLQVKGWMPPEPQSDREDLLYYEHKAMDNGESEVTDKPNPDILRRSDNPLDIAVLQLSELEQNIERRYLKSPLSTTIQITVDNVGTVSVPAPAPSSSADGDGGEEDLAPGMKLWRKALSEVRSGSQLSLCLQQLQRSIAWERSIMKVYCQICGTGDNEELLLLCDGCDKGCHTYCHNPQISTIPEGDWFCPACIAKASGSPQKIKKPTSRNASEEKTPEVKRSKKACGTGEGSEEDMAGASPGSTSKKKAKDAKRRKTDQSVNTEIGKQESSPRVKKAKIAQDNSRDLELCRLLLSELQSHQDAWPFMSPVNPKSVPGYRKVIKKPMDFSTIREKLINSQYLNLETFIIDVNLVFENCEKFNEDDSDIGRAGHSMRRFFQRRWTELLRQLK